MCNPPMITNGIEIKMKLKILLYVRKKNVNSTLIAKNITPPMNGRFHDTIRIIIRIKDGILCIKKPPIFCRKEPSISKTSREKREMNNIKTMVRIRGIHKSLFVPIYIKSTLLY